MKIFVDRKKNLPVFVAFIAIFLVIFLGLVLITAKFKSDFKIKDCVKEIGTAQMLTGQKKGVTYKIKFPYFNYKDVDSLLQEKIYSEIENVVKENANRNLKKGEARKAVILSDFQTFAFNNNCGVSVQMQYLKNISGKKFYKTVNLVFCYGKLLGFKDIFKQDKLQDVVSAIKTEIKLDKRFRFMLKNRPFSIYNKFTDDVSNLENCAIEENNIIFSFDLSKIFKEKHEFISVAVPNSAIKEAFSNVYFNSNPKERGNEPREGNSALPEKDERADKPLIALTFDDGPEEGVTDIILDELKKNNAHATFFVVGKNVERFPNLLKREVAEGHEIGNHTYSHPTTLTHLSSADIEQQIENNAKIVESVLGFRPATVRVPGGSLNKKVISVLEAYPIINWTIDTRDWKTHSAPSTIREVKQNAADGGIVLMHDIRPSTAEAVKTIIPELKSKGFELVTVSEMFKIKNINLNKGVEYHRAEIKECDEESA